MNKPIITIDTKTTTNPAAMLAGSSRPESRIDTGTALWVGAAIVLSMLYVLGYRRMRNEQRAAEAERDTLQLIRRANAQTIKAGLVVRS